MATITFQVNLETVNRYSASQPYSATDAGNFRTTRSTWFPDAMLDNRKLKHGDEFTLSGLQAEYLRDNFTSGDHAFLTVVTEAFP